MSVDEAEGGRFCCTGGAASFEHCLGVKDGDVACNPGCEGGGDLVGYCEFVSGRMPLPLTVDSVSAGVGE